MKTCEKCGKEFETWVNIDGIMRNLKSRKYCLECSPFGERSGGRKKTQINDYGQCLFCKKPLTASHRTFCNRQCQINHIYTEYIAKWKAGKVDGIKGKAWIDVSSHIKRYLLEKFNYKCSKCGWSEINPYTNRLPLEIEHIDGDATNNTEENLTLLCPNCHSLTKTYRGANKGNGTRDIKWLSRSGTTNA